MALSILKSLVTNYDKPALSNSSRLKGVFEKRRFSDRLVWTVGQTVERKLCFHILPAQCRCCLNYIEHSEYK